MKPQPDRGLAPIYLTPEQARQFPTLAARGYIPVRASRSYRCPACGAVQSYVAAEGEILVCTMVRAEVRCAAPMEAI